MDTQIKPVVQGEGSDFVCICCVRQLLEYLQFCVCIFLNYVDKLKKVKKRGKKNNFERMLIVRNLELHLFCFSQGKRANLFAAQKGLNVLKILVTSII